MEINQTVYNAFIDPDEKYMVACVDGREDSITPCQPNYYIFFRDPDDAWYSAVNLGEKINIPGSGAIAQSVSADGKYFFFSSQKTDGAEVTKLNFEWMKKRHSSPQNGNSDIYWVDAEFIPVIREKIELPQN